MQEKKKKGCRKRSFPRASCKTHPASFVALSTLGVVGAARNLGGELYNLTIKHYAKQKNQLLNLRLQSTKPHTPVAPSLHMLFALFGTVMCTKGNLKNTRSLQIWGRGGWFINLPK